MMPYLRFHKRKRAGKVMWRWILIRWYKSEDPLLEWVLCNSEMKEYHEAGELQCWIEGHSEGWERRGDEEGLVWVEHELGKKQIQDHACLDFSVYLYIVLT